MKAYTAAVCAVGLAVIAASARADELDDRVEKITFATTGAAVIALMGRVPDAQETTVFGGSVSKTRWRWSSSNGRIVVIVMVQNRVLYTKICTGMAGTDC